MKVTYTRYAIVINVRRGVSVNSRADVQNYNIHLSKRKIK